MKTGQIPENVGHSMSPQGKIKTSTRAKRAAEKLASGNYKFVDGYIVPIK